MKKHTLILNQFRRPRQISEYGRIHNIRRCVYEIGITGEVLVYGKDNGNEWQRGTFLDRSYRRAGGIPGWPIGDLSCSTSSKMRYDMAEHFPNVVKDDVYLTIFDYTYDLQNKSEYEADAVLLNEENRRVRAYEATYGRRPKLNIQETKSRSFVSDDLFTALFEN